MARQQGDFAVPDSSETLLNFRANALQTMAGITENGITPLRRKMLGQVCMFLRFIVSYYYFVQAFRLKLIATILYSILITEMFCNKF